MTAKPDIIPTLTFSSAAKWRKWLEANHARSTGIWLQIYKKETGVKTVSYNEALDEALCYGWIDGQKKPVDGKSWLQKFTPRRLNSMWSKRNTEHAERLMKEGRMHAAGLKEIEAAQTDGRWAAAYHAQSQMEIPGDFLQRLAQNKKAEAFFKTLNKANLYAIAWRLQTAKKPETRAKRMEVILNMMAAGEKFH